MFPPSSQEENTELRDKVEELEENIGEEQARKTSLLPHILQHK